MAQQTLTSQLATAANNIVTIGSRSNNILTKSQKDYSNFSNFLELKVKELETIELPSTKKIKELSNINVTNSLGNTGGLLSSLLSGGLDLAGLIQGKEDPKISSKSSGSVKSKPKVSGGKLKLGGMRAIGVANAVFAGLDFTTGLSEGESVGKAAAGAGGSLAGSLLGGAIGQTLIPVPGLGFVIGSAVGGFLGGYTADRVVDAVGSNRRDTKSSLRSELDVKIQRAKEEQKSKVEPEALKNLKNSATTFSNTVDKFISFFGLSGGILSFKTNKDQEYNEGELPGVDANNPASGDYIDYNVSGGDLPSKLRGSPFGMRWGKPHNGIDYNVSSGTAISIIQPGEVIEAGNYDPDGYGNGVKINHSDGSTTFYAHLSRINVKEGQKIEAGTLIGYTGGIPGAPGSGNSKGEHLHYEYLTNGNRVDPADGNNDDKYFRFGGDVKVKPKTPPQTTPSQVPTQAQEQPQKPPTKDPIAEAVSGLTGALMRPKPKLIAPSSPPELPPLTPREIRRRGGASNVMANLLNIPTESAEDIIARAEKTSKTSIPTKKESDSELIDSKVILSAVEQEVRNIQNIMEYPEYDNLQSTTTIIDRPVTTTVVVGNNKGSSAPMVIPMNNGSAPMIINTGPTANQLRDSIAEFIILSSIG